MAVPILLTILAAVALVSLVSFVGVLTLYLQKKLDEILSYLVSFAAGGLLGAVFFDLLPEAVEKTPNWAVGVLAGILVFFIIEMFLHWHHHHHGHKKNHIHPVGYLNLIGDGAHNFIDGMIIAAAFLINVPLGLVTTLAVILHEIPQEFGDFGILIYSGFPKNTALGLNFATALTAVAGALVAFFLSSLVQNFELLLVPFAAGSFIYIATADLLPEIHKHGGKELLESVGQVALLFLGIFMIWAVGKFLG